MSTDSTPDYLLLLAEPFCQMLYSIAPITLPAWGQAHQVAVDPLTRLLVPVVASYILIYLVELGAYLASAPQWIPLSLCLIASTVSVVYTIRLERKGSDPAPFPWDCVIT